MTTDDITAVPASWIAPIQPGDTLIIGFTNRVSPAEGSRIRERFGEVTPDVTVVIMDNVAALAVYRRGAA